MPYRIFYWLDLKTKQLKASELGRPAPVPSPAILRVDIRQVSEYNGGLEGDGRMCDHLPMQCIYSTIFKGGRLGRKHPLRMFPPSVRASHRWYTGLGILPA